MLLGDHVFADRPGEVSALAGSPRFDAQRLTVPIQAIVRFSEGFRESMTRTDNLAVDLDTQVVSVDDQPVHLTGKEYAVLELLTLRQGTIVTRQMLLNHLYSGIDEPELKIIDVFVCKLRKKLAQATGGDQCIKTVWGRGYMLREPVANGGHPDTRDDAGGRA